MRVIVRNGHTHAPDAINDALKAHFSERQIVDLTVIMNAWSRIAIGHRTHPA